MPALEYVVRPFAAPGALGSTLIPSNPGTTTDTARVTWGAQATLPTAKTTGINIQTCNEGVEETGRTTESVKISQPNNPDNFLMVARAKTLTLKKSDKQSSANMGSTTAWAGATTNFGFGEVSGITDGTTDNCQVNLKLNNNTSGG